MASSQTDTNGHHVVVAGGGFAGLGAAYTIRERLQPKDRVTLIAPNGQFVFAPSLVWAALGRPLHHSTFALEPALSSRGIDLVRSAVREVRASDHVVTTEEDEIQYDRLIIATGGRPDPSAVPGLAGEFQAASWIVGEESAMEARNVLQRLFADPGPLVVGAAQDASYLSGVYELALALDAALRNKGLRHRVPITFVTPEPYLGDLGFDQSAARPRLERLFAERDIATYVGVSIDRVHGHEVRLSNSTIVPAKAIVIMPPFSGSVNIWKSAKLTDERGLIPVTDQYRHTVHPDIYAAGVASYFEKPVPPLHDRRAPHTGYLSLHMGKAAGDNAALSLGYRAPAPRTLPRLVDVRVLDGGGVGLVLTSRGKNTLHHTAQQLPGRVAHALKSSIARYLVWRLRTGRIDLP